ncbi:MAG: hypothetical protein KatS3mg031_2392 [Chitinophagales bacterium]|nr:MAG: hypothetical protein KatS3mg031_2392 [Chitinophagales bacterium]
MKAFREYVVSHKEKGEKLLSRLEMAGLLFTMLALVLMLKKIPFSGYFFILGLSALTAVYLSLGIFCKEFFGLSETDFFSKALTGAYLALSFTTLGILFLIMRWPAARLLTEGGFAATLLFFLFFTYRLYLVKTDEKYKIIMHNLIVRMLPVLITIGILIIIQLKS